jgi:hypothetical protein
LRSVLQKYGLLREVSFGRYNSTPNVSTLSSGYRFMSPHSKQDAGRNKVLIPNSGDSQFEIPPKNRLLWLSLLGPVVIGDINSNYAKTASFYVVNFIIY